MFDAMTSALLGIIQGLFFATLALVDAALDVVLTPVLTALGLAASLPSLVVSFLHSFAVMVDVLIPNTYLLAGLGALFACYSVYLGVRLMLLPFHIALKLVGWAMSAIGSVLSKLSWIAALLGLLGV